MRVLICGSRNWDDPEPIKDYMDSLPAEVVIIQGEAKGADSIAKTYAEERGLRVEGFPAHWGKHGRAAGVIRNRQMLIVGKPDIVVAFARDLSNSRGTNNMVEQARAAGVPVEVHDGGA